MRVQLWQRMLAVSLCVGFGLTPLAQADVKYRVNRKIPSLQQREQMPVVEEIHPDQVDQKLLPEKPVPPPKTVSPKTPVKSEPAPEKSGPAKQAKQQEKPKLENPLLPDDYWPEPASPIQPAQAEAPVTKQVQTPAEPRRSSQSKPDKRTSQKESPKSIRYSSEAVPLGPTMPGINPALPTSEAPDPEIGTDKSQPDRRQLNGKVSETHTQDKPAASPKKRRTQKAKVTFPKVSPEPSSTLESAPVPDEMTKSTPGNRLHPARVSRVSGPGVEQYRHAVLLAKDNRYKEAFAEYTNALEQNPLLADAYVGLSSLYGSKKDWEEVITTAEKGLKLKKKHFIDPFNRVQAHYNLSLAYCVAGDYGEAKKHWKRVKKAKHPANKQLKQFLQRSCKP